MADEDYRRLSCVDCAAAFARTTTRGRLRIRCQGCSPTQARPGGTARAKRCCRCGVDYSAPTAAGKYCSTRCRVEAGNEAQAQRKAAAKAARPPRSCKWCSKAFTPAYGDKRLRYCSTACEEARRAKERSGTSHRRRAKRYGVPFQHVNRLKVFERDRWRCQLCSRKVGLADAELDHIVPLSKGGPHSYENTQCSCKACNSVKRDRPQGQQRLFG